jgi:poly-gamma-glutamate system protein
LIGLEWSVVTTTLGDLEAKRTSCDPRWAVRVLRWFKEAGLVRGDRVAILSSASFPGFLLAALIAAEEMGLSVLLVPSLAASTWGANVPELLLPDLLTLLRRRGVLRTAPAFCTLGGDGEIGGGLAPEGVALLRESARRNGIPLLEEERLEMMVAEKTRRVLAFDPKLVVQIGGSHANLGTDPDVTRLPGGLHFPEASSRRMSVASYGNGVLGKLAEVGLPVIHLLNVRDLARRNGIPFDGAPERKGPATRGRRGAIVGLVAFALGLKLFSRWELE